jgi:hypothetical protein
MIPLETIFTSDCPSSSILAPFRFQLRRIANFDANGVRNRDLSSPSPEASSNSLALWKME